MILSFKENTYFFNSHLSKSYIWPLLGIRLASFHLTRTRREPQRRTVLVHVSYSNQKSDFSKSSVNNLTKVASLPSNAINTPSMVLQSRGGSFSFSKKNNTISIEKLREIENIKNVEKNGNKSKQRESNVAKKRYYTSYSKLSEIKLLTIGIASPLRILQWAEKTLPNGKIYGEVLNANTLHHKTFKPQKGGLFCERIFGPLKDFECACGKIDKSGIRLATQGRPKQFQINFNTSQTSYPTNEETFTKISSDDSRKPKDFVLYSGVNQNNPPVSEVLEGNAKQEDFLSQKIDRVQHFTRKFCPDCDVEYTWSVIRRYQLGYIKLSSPVTHIWFLKGTPSYLSLLLDIKKRYLQFVTYCSETLTIEKSSLPFYSIFPSLPKGSLRAYLTSSTELIPFSLKQTEKIKKNEKFIPFKESIDFKQKFYGLEKPLSNKEWSKYLKKKDSSSYFTPSIALLPSSPSMAKTRARGLETQGSLGHRASLDAGKLVKKTFISDTSEDSDKDLKQKKYLKPFILNGTLFKKGTSLLSTLLFGPFYKSLCTSFNIQNDFVFKNKVENKPSSIALQYPRWLELANETNRSQGVIFEPYLKKIMKKLPIDLYILCSLERFLHKSSLNLSIKNAWETLYKQAFIKAIFKSRLLFNQIANFSKSKIFPQRSIKKNLQWLRGQPLAGTVKQSNAAERAIQEAGILSFSDLLYPKEGQQIAKLEKLLTIFFSKTSIMFLVANKTLCLKKIKMKYSYHILKSLLSLKAPILSLKYMTKFLQKNSFLEIEKQNAIENEKFFIRGSMASMASPSLANDKREIKMKMNFIQKALTKSFLNLLILDFFLKRENTKFFLKCIKIDTYKNREIKQRALPLPFPKGKVEVERSGRNVKHETNLQTANFSRAFNLERGSKAAPSMARGGPRAPGHRASTLQKKFLLQNSSENRNAFSVAQPHNPSKKKLPSRLVKIMTLLKLYKCYSILKDKSSFSSQLPESEIKSLFYSKENLEKQKSKKSNNLLNHFPFKKINEIVDETRDPIELFEVLSLQWPSKGWLYNPWQSKIGQGVITPSLAVFALGEGRSKKYSLSTPVENEGLRFPFSFGDGKAEDEGHELVKKKTKIAHNIYTLSHRERWDNEKDWQIFSVYSFGLKEYTDFPIEIYKNRLSFLINSDEFSSFQITTETKTVYEPSRKPEVSIEPLAKVEKNLPLQTNLNLPKLQKSFSQPGIFSSFTFPSAIEAHSFYSGAGIVQQLLNEFDFYEIKKCDKQNRLLLYQLNKYILKLKKQVQIFVYDKAAQVELRECCKKRDLLIRRTKLVRKILRKNTDPASMILTVLPVLPPDLRPIVRMGNQIAASDLNRLYQRVIYRNDRLKKFLKDPAISQSFEMKYAQRLLQEAVDNLMQNGKSGPNSEKDGRGRALKSLSDILKGKQGRFRQFLLGKRVDYSGRSVIVVGPKLKLYECGIPVEMAKELYLPFLLKSILNKNYAKTVVGAKSLIQKNSSLANELLREIMQVSPVLLNRAPTLHRLGIQAFLPKLIEGRAILLHPLVCSAFNADFDGDQMAVHVPITVEARAEAWKMMLSRNSILSPATGDPLAIPSQDMVLGCYYLTTYSNNGKILKGSGMYFNNIQDVIKLYDQQLIDIHAFVWVKFLNVQKAFYNTSSITLDTKKTIKKGIKNSRINEFWNSFIKTNESRKFSLQNFEYIENGKDQEDPFEIRISLLGQWQEINSNYQKTYDSNHTLISQYFCTTPGRILFNIMIQKVIDNEEIL